MRGSPRKLAVAANICALFAAAGFVGFALLLVSNFASSPDSSVRNLRIVRDKWWQAHILASNSAAAAPIVAQPLRPASTRVVAAPTPAATRSTRVPKVAMMFLVRGMLQSDDLWKQFFASAALLQLKDAPQVDWSAADLSLKALLGRELLPPTPYRDTFDHMTCWSDARVTRLKAIADAKYASENNTDYVPYVYDPSFAPRTDVGHPLYLNQSLFSLYVHPQVDFPGYPETSIFYKREVGGRSYTEHSTHSLVTAERQLLRAALTDTTNHKFLLLSEACVPLYHPAVVYAQLVAEKASRVRARLHDWNPELFRAHKAMETEHFKLDSHWRKSSQWKALNRVHARLVVADEHLEPVFAMLCKPMRSCLRRLADHFCVSDEHYIPSLLSMYGLEQDTAPVDLTSTDWSLGGLHPKTYTGDEVTLDLLHELRLNGRSPDKCAEREARITLEALQLFKGSDGLRAAADDAEDGYVDDVDDGGRRLQQFYTEDDDNFFAQAWKAWQPLSTTCPLFARKFDAISIHNYTALSTACHGVALGCSFQDIAAA